MLDGATLGAVALAQETATCDAMASPQAHEVATLLAVDARGALFEGGPFCQEMRATAFAALGRAILCCGAVARDRLQRAGARGGAPRGLCGRSLHVDLPVHDKQRALQDACAGALAAHTTPGERATKDAGMSFPVLSCP